jgi:ATP-binding cassette subfamily F protein 3
MSILIARELSKYYGVQDVFDDVSLEIEQGTKIALVGPNGSGKTTLLRLIAEVEPSDEGTIQTAKDLRIGYLPQQAGLCGAGTLWEAMQSAFTHIHALEEKLRRLEAAMGGPDGREDAMAEYGETMDAFEEAGGYVYEARIRQVLAGLGFDAETFEQPVSHLSGGQRTRALLARLLLEDPDLLLLDEPTNHLDLEGIEWLEGYLKAQDNALIVVAHDRAFLDAVADQVWEMAWGRLERYRGNYSAYQAQRAERRARRQAEYERQQQTIAETEEFIRRNIAGQRTREAQGRRKRLDRLERLERPQEYEPLHLHLGDVSRSGDLVLGLYDLLVGYTPEEPLLHAEKFELRRGQRVALLGPNGSGKTTLIRTILREVAPLEGTVELGVGVQLGYFAQGHANLDPERSVLETIVEAGQPIISQARNLLAQYRFTGDDVFKRVGDLSGGEQARVALAVLALQGANFLVLDEPTNHLDIPSQEVLQEVLNHFEGTMLMVTHDRYLIRQLGTRVWAIEQDRLWAFERGYEAYHRWRIEQRERTRAQAPDPEEAAEERRRAAQRAREGARKRAMARRARDQEDLERTIHALEQRQAALSRELAEASEQQAVARVRELGDEYRRIEDQLEKLILDWAELAA